MEGVELNRDVERMLHKMKTKFRLLGSNYGRFNGEMIYEYEKVVVSNKYFSFEDFLKIRSLNLLFFSVFQGGYYRMLFQYMRSWDFDLVGFFERFMNPDDEGESVDYHSYVSDFKRACHAELFDTLSELKEQAEMLYSVNEDVGEPVRLNPYFYSRLMYREKAWVHSLFRRLFRDQLSPNEGSNEFYEIFEVLLEVSEKSIINLRSLHLPEPTPVNHDFISWRRGKFLRPLSDYRKNGEIRYSLGDGQKAKIRSFVTANSQLAESDFDFVAVETIFPRNDLFYDLTFVPNSQAVEVELMSEISHG